MAHTEQLLEPVLENLLGAVETGQAAALAYVNGGAGLADFAKIFNSAYGRLLDPLPALMFVEGTTEEVDAPDEWTGVRHQLSFEIYVSGPDAETAQVRVMRYARAVRKIWRDMTPSQIVAGMATAGAARIERIRIRFAVQGRAQSNQFVNAARLEVAVLLIER